MTKTMIDCRCPRCNAPVRGREDVVHVADARRHRAVRNCPRCATTVRFVIAADKPYSTSFGYYDITPRTSENQ